MSFRFIEDHRGAYPVRLMCAVLEVSPAGYYAWRGRPQSARATANATLLAEIRQVHHDSAQRYGSPRVHAVLRTQGRGASRGRIERLMRRYGIRAIIAPPRRVRTTDSRHKLPIAPNLIARDFTAAAPNRVWLTDITYIPTTEGWLYLAAIMDLCSRKIVGWAMRDHMRVELVSSALTMAIRQQRPRAGLIHHSDRGVQYASHEYRAALAAAGITASMSRRADCFDNAPMESFFHTLKTELVHHRQYQTRVEATRDIFTFIEGFYNRTRLHSAIGYIAPIQMELKAA
jgi:transposase InsO family protein